MKSEVKVWLSLGAVVFVVALFGTYLVWAAKEDAKAPGPDAHLVSGGFTNVWHDDRRGVTCWASGNGLSCLPDSVLRDGGAP
jgi:hypothetical protein